MEERPRIYVTDARSVFDYLGKDSTSTSSDRRMALEGALLRETVRRRNAAVRWIDGEQNMANILTKAKADMNVLFEFLRDGKICLVRTGKQADQGKEEGTAAEPSKGFEGRSDEAEDQG